MSDERRRYEGKFRVTSPDEISMTLELTMPLGDWKRLRDQLKTSSFPAFKLAEHIDNAIHHAEIRLNLDCEAKS